MNKSPNEKTQFKKGGIPWNKNKKGVQVWSEASRKKLSDSTKGIKHPEVAEAHRGDKNKNWKGGVTKLEGYINWQKNLWSKRKREANGTHTFDDWEKLKAQYNWTCPACNKREPEIKLTEDHIVPLSKGGSDNIENIQPLCKSCNCRKHDKTIKYENGHNS